MHKEPLLGNNIMCARCKIINICSLNINTKETGNRFPVLANVMLTLTCVLLLIDLSFNDDVFA